MTHRRQLIFLVAFLALMVFVLGGVTYAQHNSVDTRSGNPVFQGVLPVIEKVFEDVDNVNNIAITKYALRYRETASYQTASVQEALRTSGQLSTRFIEGIATFFDRIRAGFSLVFQGLPGFERTYYGKRGNVDIEHIPVVDEGVVVFSSSGNREADEATLARLRSTFSDEVLIVPDDDQTGIIKPIFRSREGGETYTGEDYFYLLVPLVRE